MKKSNDRYIKYVELIPPDEFKKNKVFQSMIRTFKEHSDTDGHDMDMRMVVLTKDGDTKNMRILDLVCYKDAWLNSSLDGRCFCAVKMLWSDGKWEYGLKRKFRQERLYRKNGLLKPIYTKIGEVGKNGLLVDTMSQDYQCGIPAWILNMIPMWNERIRDALCRNDPTIETKMFNLDDWRGVQITLDSEYATDQAYMKNININGKQVKMPVTIELDENKYLGPASTVWNEDMMNSGKFGSVLDRIQTDHMTISCYSYLKSIYYNKVKCVNEYKVIPLSDVIMLTKAVWNVELHKYTECEVWNSIDETCKGNV